MIKKTILTITVLSSLFSAANADYMQQMRDFQNYKASQEDQFDTYQKAQMKAFEEYKKEIGVFWEKPKLSTKKSWLSYSEDKKTRSDVDFEKNTIVVETVAASEEEAKRNLQTALAKAVTIDTKTLQETDPLEKKLAKIKLPSDMIHSKVDSKPILSTVVFDKKPTLNAVKKYVNKHTADSKIKVKESNKVQHARVYSVSVQLPDDTMLKRSKLYLNDVEEHAAKRDLPKPLIFAIMHSESSFNPRARSHIPAYGLMQIVPNTAGRDTYKFLYKQDKLVSGSYLYNSKNNIKMGSAYLHILYYRYLKKIKNPDSRLYCTIAAYNTGAGNIAYAFTKKYNMNNAAPIINKLTPEEVYARLLKDLRFDEPKHYLKKVSKRMAAYKKVYGI
ncbi:murein transglycosylase domain-containing protein [Sulfurimonas sp.]|uniref:murein transglycosylase domain-containing protein n=1 Tax=Sulfurimonas sp. TaxID=2022749 RepID=UPI003563BC41